MRQKSHVTLPNSKMPSQASKAGWILLTAGAIALFVFAGISAFGDELSYFWAA